MPGADEHSSPQRRIIYLAFHQLLKGFYPGLTIVSPGRCLSLIQALGLTRDSRPPSSLVASNIELALSFDDGYAELGDILPEWLPLLNHPPRVFVPTAWIGKENHWDYLHPFTKSRHLRLDEIAALSCLGVVFGSHGHSHRPLSLMGEVDIREELSRSKHILEECTGRVVDSLAYPYGMINDRVTAIAMESGYTTGYTMNLPHKADAAMSQGRLPVYSLDLVATIRAKLPGQLLNALMRQFNYLYRAGATTGAHFNRLTRHG